MHGWLSIPPVTQEPSPCLHPNPISILKLASDAIRWGKCSRVELASQSPSVTNRALRRAWEILCDCLPEVSLIQASLDYFPVETSLAAFGIVQGWYHEAAKALQMLSVMVWLLSSLFGASQLPEPSVLSSHTSYLSHGNGRLHPPIPVASVRQASSTSAESSACGAEPFWRLCPSPSQVDHLRTACQALYLPHHHPCLPHPPHLRNVQDRSHCLR